MATARRVPRCGSWVRPLRQARRQGWPPRVMPAAGLLKPRKFARSSRAKVLCWIRRICPRRSRCRRHDPHAKRPPHRHHRRVSALRLGLCAAHLGRHDGGVVRGVLAAARERRVRCGYRRRSRPADPGAGLPKGRLPGPRHYRGRRRLIRDRRVVPTESRPVYDRLRGLARALCLRRWTF